MKLSFSVQKPVKHIEIEHVHEQTIALLAKLEKQGAEQREEAAKLSSEQRNEVRLLTGYVECVYNIGSCAKDG